MLNGVSFVSLDAPHLIRVAGTLRQNLDPFELYDDATLNDTLRSVGLFSIQNETDDHRITLDSFIMRNGGSLSVGQRQIVALARAILRESKLLIMDEGDNIPRYKRCRDVH